MLIPTSNEGLDDDETVETVLTNNQNNNNNNDIIRKSNKDEPQTFKMPGNDPNLESQRTW